MDEYWNLIDMKQNVFAQVDTSETDEGARAAIITGIDSIIKASLEIEESRELLPAELAILIECPGWLDLCEEVVYGET